MNPGAFVFFLLGLAIFTGIVAWQGVDAIATFPARMGLDLLWFGLYYLLPLILAAISWRPLFPPDAMPSVHAAVRASWIGFSVNWLLPAAQIGGEFVKARLVISESVRAPLAVGSIVVDKLVQGLTQVIFALLGLGLLLASFVEADQGLVVGVVAFIVFVGSGLYGFHRLQRVGLFGVFARSASRLAGCVLGTGLVGKADCIDGEIQAIYSRPGALFRACIWRLGFRTALAGEVWLALSLLAQPVSIIDVLIIESLGQAVRGAAFAIPGALGIQEGGFIVLGLAVGLPAEAGLAISLCKRVRELLVGIPGLMVWQLLEYRSLRAGSEKLHEP